MSLWPYFSNTKKLYEGANWSRQIFSTFYLVNSPWMADMKSMRMYVKWISFRVDYISRFSRIFFFLQNISHAKYHKISHSPNLICGEYQVKTSEKWKWGTKVDLVIFHVFYSKQQNEAENFKACKDFFYRWLRLMLKHTLKTFHIILW